MQQPENEGVKQSQDPSGGCSTEVERKRASQCPNRCGQKGMKITGRDVPIASAVPVQAPKHRRIQRVRTAQSQPSSWSCAPLPTISPPPSIRRPLISRVCGGNATAPKDRTWRSPIIPRRAENDGVSRTNSLHLLSCKC